MEITEADLRKYYKRPRAYQEVEFDKIAAAIRYVDGTTKEEDMIVALDFADRIRKLKGNGAAGGGTHCVLWDNFPYGCGEAHVLHALDYSVVSCVTEKLRDPAATAPDACLCDDHWYYDGPNCGRLHGLKALDYSLVNAVFPYTVVTWETENAS